jgi:hypothetical protein
MSVERGNLGIDGLGLNYAAEQLKIKDGMMANNSEALEESPSVESLNKVDVPLPKEGEVWQH